MAQTLKPASLSVAEEAIPSLLKETDRWLCWSWVWNKNKWDKPPLSPRTGRAASSTDSSTWTTFAVALEAHRAGRFDGVGFTFGLDEATGLVFSGFDLDDCIEDDEIHPSAIYLASCLDSYTEYSPSGKGIKVFTTGKIPPGSRTDKARHFELYDSGRYFTVTGRHVDWSPRTVNPRQEQWALLHASLWPSVPGKSRKVLDDRALALAALAGLNAARADHYDTWLQVGMALRSVADDLLDAWDTWSRHSPDKYSEGACKKKWDSFGKSGVGIGSLIHWARDDGWEIPQGKAVPSTSRLPYSVQKENGKASSEEGQASPCLDDPHMGDGLTEQDGAGPWELTIEMGKPKRFFLKSPIWENSPYLQSGCIVLTEKEIFLWPLVRIAAAVQAPGCYVLPDLSRKPVWDGRRGPQLLRRLLLSSRKIDPSIDYDRVLAAAEYILNQSKKATLVTEDKRDKATARPILRFEDGSVMFRCRDLAAQASRDGVGIAFENIREAAQAYGREECPRIGGKRPRYIVFSPEQIEQIERATISG